MRILVIGGTRFVGRHFVTAALDRGHELTLLHRGRTNPSLFPGAEHLVADRDADLGVLRGRTFEATVDVCAYVPRQVSHLAEALGGRGGQHLQVSSVSAYAPMAGPMGDESAPLNPTPDPPTETVAESTYGNLKADCERAAEQVYGAALTVVRPSYVIGPYDASGRFPWWVDRLARGGEVLAPGPADAPFQAVDARDLAAFMVGLLEAGRTGRYHAAAPEPPYTFGDMLADVAAAVGPEGTGLAWADPRWLAERGIGGGVLPLWDEGARAWDLAVDPAKALGAGLRPRSVGDSARDTLAWLGGDGAALPEGTGLDPARETALLDELRRTAP